MQTNLLNPVLRTVFRLTLKIKRENLGPAPVNFLKVHDNSCEHLILVFNSSQAASASTKVCVTPPPPRPSLTHHQTSLAEGRCGQQNFGLPTLLEEKANLSVCPGVLDGARLCAQASQVDVKSSCNCREICV